MDEGRAEPKHSCYRASAPQPECRRSLPRPVTRPLLATRIRGGGRNVARIGSQTDGSASDGPSRRLCRVGAGLVSAPPGETKRMDPYHARSVRPDPRHLRLQPFSPSGTIRVRSARVYRPREWNDGTLARRARPIATSAWFGLSSSILNVRLQFRWDALPLVSDLSSATTTFRFDSRDDVLNHWR